MVATKAKRMASWAIDLFRWVWDQSSDDGQNWRLVKKGKSCSVQSAGPEKWKFYCPSCFDSGWIHCLQHLSRSSQWGVVQGFRWVRGVAALHTISRPQLGHYPRQCSDSQCTIYSLTLWAHNRTSKPWLRQGVANSNIFPLTRRTLIRLNSPFLSSRKSSKTSTRRMDSSPPSSLLNSF